MEDERILRLYSRYCDLFERMWQEEYGTPLDPNDGLMHTSPSARAFANEILDALQDEGFLS